MIWDRVYFAKVDDDIVVEAGAGPGKYFSISISICTSAPYCGLTINSL